MTKKTKILSGIFMILSVISAILFRTCRYNWVFLNSNFGFDLPIILFMPMVILSIWFGILFIMNIYGSKLYEQKFYKPLLIISCILSSVLFIFAVSYATGCAIDEMTQGFTIYLLKTLGEGAVLMAVPFFVIFYPKLSCKAKKAVGALSLAIAILFSVNSLCPLTPYKITSDPTVIDNGKEMCYNDEQ